MSEERREIAGLTCADGNDLPGRGGSVQVKAGPGHAAAVLRLADELALDDIKRWPGSRLTRMTWVRTSTPSRSSVTGRRPSATPACRG